MTIFTQLRDEASQMARAMQERRLELEKQLAEIERRKTEVEAKRNMASGALQRLANYPVQVGVDYLCPHCWVTEGKMSPLKPIPSETDDDIMRCRICQFELLIPGRS